MSLSSNYSSQCRLRFYSLPLTFSFLFLLPTRLFQLIYPLGSLYSNLSSLDNTSIFKLSILTQARFLSIFSKLFSFDHLLSSSSPSSKVFSLDHRLLSFYPTFSIKSFSTHSFPGISTNSCVEFKAIDHQSRH